MLSGYGKKKPLRQSQQNPRESVETQERRLDYKITRAKNTGGSSDESQSVQRALADDERRERDHCREHRIAAGNEYLGRLILLPELIGARRGYDAEQ